MGRHLLGCKELSEVRGQGELHAAEAARVRGCARSRRPACTCPVPALNPRVRTLGSRTWRHACALAAGYEPRRNLRKPAAQTQRHVNAHTALLSPAQSRKTKTKSLSRRERAIVPQKGTELRSPSLLEGRLKILRFQLKSASLDRNVGKRSGSPRRSGPALGGPKHRLRVK